MNDIQQYTQTISFVQAIQEHPYYAKIKSNTISFVQLIQEHPYNVKIKSIIARTGSYSQQLFTDISAHYGIPFKKILSVLYDNTGMKHMNSIKISNIFQDSFHHRPRELVMKLTVSILFIFLSMLPIIQIRKKLQRRRQLNQSQKIETKSLNNNVGQRNMKQTQRITTAMAVASMAHRQVKARKKVNHNGSSTTPGKYEQIDQETKNNIVLKSTKKEQQKLTHHQSSHQQGEKATTLTVVTSKSDDNSSIHTSTHEKYVTPTAHESDSVVSPKSTKKVLLNQATHQPSEKATSPKGVTWKDDECIAHGDIPDGTTSITKEKKHIITTTPIIAEKEQQTMTHLHRQEKTTIPLPSAVRPKDDDDDDVDVDDNKTNYTHNSRTKETTTLNDKNVVIVKLTKKEHQKMTYDPPIVSKLS